MFVVSDNLLISICKMEEENQRKRRSKGSGSFNSEQKRLKSSGKSYKTYKNKMVPEKNYPKEQV